MFVLVDCNNFFVSCEKVFNPGLEGHPILVLSNNDGCVVSRSQEVKQLGIKMGEPFFKIRDFCERHRIVVFSSNFQLYGDLSQRVMDVLSEIAPEIQISSIDEAFLKFPAKMPETELFNYTKEIRETIKKWVGIPTSIGIAPTKTLAKVANHLAKKDQVNGVYSLASKDVQESVLKDFPIEDLWGIGSSSKEKLHSIGIYTAWEFKEQDPVFILKKMGVVGERMLWELRGVSCIPLEKSKPKKSITCSRSFGQTITDPEDLCEALSSHVNSAFRKLRKQKSCASTLCVFLESPVDSFTGVRQHYATAGAFTFPTNETSQALNLAKECLMQIFRKGQPYKKCGVVLLDLVPEENVPLDLFSGNFDPKRRQLEDTVDALNNRLGKDTLFYGARKIDPQWKMRSENKSLHTSTAWESLPIVRSK